MLIDKFNQGASNRELALIFDSTPKAISVLLSRLRKEGLVGYHLKPWTIEEDGMLIQLRGLNTTNKDIADIMGKTEPSVKHRVGALVKKGMLPKYEGNYWEVGLNSIRKPGGCHDKNKPTILYLVKFDEFYKIGITQKSIKERLYGAPEYTVIDFIDTDLEFAFEMESIIKKSVTTFIPENIWFERNGKTECFISETPITSLEQLV
jgi:DNA-binding CsgD family transcriptional regulator